MSPGAAAGPCEGLLGVPGVGAVAVLVVVVVDGVTLGAAPLVAAGCVGVIVAGAAAPAAAVVVAVGNGDVASVSEPHAAAQNAAMIEKYGPVCRFISSSPDPRAEQLDPLCALMDGARFY